MPVQVSFPDCLYFSVKHSVKLFILERMFNQRHSGNAFNAVVVEDFVNSLLLTNML